MDDCLLYVVGEHWYVVFELDVRNLYVILG